MSPEPPGPPSPSEPPRTELTDRDAGRWVVSTRTSRYFLDLDSHQVMRHPGGRPARAGSDTGGSSIANLRSDGDVVRLRSVALCRVGESLVLYLDLRGDGVVTIRQTTPVTAIEAAPQSGSPKSGGSAG
jgi:hypothetical protein